MTPYENQHTAVKLAIHILSAQSADKEVPMPLTLEGLRDAATTIAAVNLMEKKILILEDLIKVAQDFVADTPVDREEVMRHQNEFKKLLNKIQ